jgi:tripartite ATP-independent transporter DctP family solute receptor
MSQPSPRASRRAFLLGSSATLATTAAAALVGPRVKGASTFRGRQYHNQQPESPLHAALTSLWASVAAQSGGRLMVETFALNDRQRVTDPEAIELVRNGGIEFYTAGVVFDRVLPSAAAICLPFIFKTRSQAFAVVDGPLGRLWQQQLAPKGIISFPGAYFEHGYRHLTTRLEPILNVGDLKGLKLRVPPSHIIEDYFRTLGANTTVTRVIDLREALLARKVDAQENPLVVIQQFGLYSAQRHLILSQHMWNGFQLIGNLDFWHRLPADLQDLVIRNLPIVVQQQRLRQGQLNQDLIGRLQQEGLQIHRPNLAKGFKENLGPFYRRWREQIGLATWNILERQLGPIGPTSNASGMPRS